MSTGLHPHQDLLVTTAIRFLTTVCRKTAALHINTGLRTFYAHHINSGDPLLAPQVSTSVHHQLFSSSQVLQNVCEKIITPNVQL